MNRNAKLILSIGVIATVLTGCQSHQAKIDSLQKEYDRLSAQMKQDCSAEYLKVPPTLSPKCTEENKNVTEAYQRLQDERAKQ